MLCRSSLLRTREAHHRIISPSYAGDSGSSSSILTHHYHTTTTSLCVCCRRRRRCFVGLVLGIYTQIMLARSPGLLARALVGSPQIICKSLQNTVCTQRHNTTYSTHARADFDGFIATARYWQSTPPLPLPLMPASVRPISHRRYRARVSSSCDV